MKDHRQSLYAEVTQRIIAELEAGRFRPSFGCASMSALSAISAEAGAAASDQSRPFVPYPGNVRARQYLPIVTIEASGQQLAYPSFTRQYILSCR